MVASAQTPSSAQTRARPKKKSRGVRGKARVVDSVRDWFKAQHWESGSRLPSIREIAQKTNASPSTVYLIIRQLTEEGKIRTELGSGSFFVGQPGPKRAFRIALNIPSATDLPHDDYWKNGIISGILSAASSHSSRMMIMPCSMDHYVDGGLNEEILAERDEVDALILFPWRGSQAVRDSYESAGKVVVDLNAPDESATANFVSPDCLKISSHIGQVWRKSGKKRILFMSHVPLEASVSSRQRWAGLLSGVGAALGGQIHCQMTVSGTAHEEDGAKAMTKYLQEHQEPPDAIYCVGDPQAMGALRALRKAGHKVPEDISLIGGNGFELAAYAELTRTRQSLRNVGHALVDMVAERLTHQRSVPAIYLPMDMIIGSSTTAAENALLRDGLVLQEPVRTPRSPSAG